MDKGLRVIQLLKFTASTPQTFHKVWFKWFGCGAGHPVGTHPCYIPCCSQAFPTDITVGEVLLN